MRASETAPGLRKTIPWGLVGMIGLVLLAERSVSRQAIRVLDADDWNYLRKGYVATCKARNYDVLFLGDSLTCFGVAPKAVAARSGRSAFNLAIPGAQAPAGACLLRRALRSGARPAGVVVEFYPPLLAMGPRENLNRWASILGVVESAKLAWTARDAGLFGTVTLGRLLPSFRARAGVRDNLRAFLRGRADGRAGMNIESARNWSRNDGAQMNAPVVSSRFETDAQFREFREYYFSRMACDPANAEGVREILTLAAEHGVTVYWLLPPIMPRLQEMLARSGFDAQHEAFLRSWQARFPNLVVVDARRSVRDPKAYTDPCHLAAPGAYAFSLTMGDFLRRALPPPGKSGGAARPPAARWVTLPASEIGPVPDEVEDTAQTRLALIEESKARGTGAARR